VGECGGPAAANAGAFPTAARHVLEARLMREYDYQSLWREIGEMRSWQINALAAVCAEKVLPIVRYLALPDTFAFAERCVEFTWASVSAKNVNTAEAARLREVFDSLPELQCEYPDSLPFAVTRALSFFDFAISAVNASAMPGEAAKNVGISLIVETAELFDSALDQHPRLEVAALGIGMVEKSSQQQLVATLRGQEKPSQEIIQLIRREARKVADLFELALPAYAYHFISGLIRAEAIRRGDSV
jgi:hypothetical protein